MLPAVHRVLYVHKIRDGGSFAAKFSSRGAEYILFIKLRTVVRGQPGIAPRIERLGFDQPVLIDSDPKRRPQNTDRVAYSELSGPWVPVSWSEAAELLRSISNLGGELNPIESSWLQELVKVASNEGRDSPSAS